MMNIKNKTFSNSNESLYRNIFRVTKYILFINKIKRYDKRYNNKTS